MSNKKLLDNIIKKTKSMSLSHDIEMEAMNLLIAGRTNSGKTRLVLKLLEDEFMDKYDDIYLVCPTYSKNSCYQKWKYKDLQNWHPLCVTLENVDSTLSLIKENVTGKTLIILDDCAAGKEMSLQKSSLTELAIGGRHYLINTIVITQQIKSIAKCYRDNLTRVITFFNPSRQDRKYLFETMCSHKMEEEWEIMKKLMNNKYSYFDIHLSHPWKCEVVLQ